MNVYIKHVKDLDFDTGVTQRWIARDQERRLIGIGKSRKEAIRNMRPESEVMVGNTFAHRFLQAPAMRWTHRTEA